MTAHGIGNTIESLKFNSVISTVQRENVWHPYYELNLEAEMDFKDKFLVNMQAKDSQNVQDVAIKILEAEIKETEDDFQRDYKNKQILDAGGKVVGKPFSIQEKLKQLKEREMLEQEAQVIDPLTIKVKRVPDDMTEDELLDIMIKFGPVTRVKIPKDMETN